MVNSVLLGAGQIFNLPRTDDFSRRGKVPSHLTAKVVSTMAFQNKIKNLSCTRFILFCKKLNNRVLPNSEFPSYPISKV